MPLTAIQIRILAELRTLADDDSLYAGGCALIANRARVSRSSVERTMRALQDQSLIELEAGPRGRRAHIWRVKPAPAGPPLADLAERLARVEEQLSEQPALVARVETIEKRQTILIDERAGRIEVAAKRAQPFETKLVPRLAERERGSLSLDWDES